MPLSPPLPPPPPKLLLPPPAPAEKLPPLFKPVAPVGKGAALLLVLASVEALHGHKSIHLREEAKKKAVAAQIARPREVFSV